MMTKEKMKDWIELLSKDKDFDAEFLIKIVNKKLGSMLSSFSTDDAPDNVSVSTFESACAAYNLGTKILSHDYCTDKYDNVDKLKMTKSAFNRWTRHVEKAAEERNSDIKTYFKLLGEISVAWW